MITGKDLMEFILANRGDKTFKDLSPEQIGYLVVEALKQDLLLYSLGKDKKINGMLLAQIDHEKKVLFILENLAMSKENLIEFARNGQKRFPDYEVQAMRHNYLRKFNPNKLYKKLKAL